MIDIFEETTRTCIVDRKVFDYHACSKHRDTYKQQEQEQGWKYIGRGKIYEINNAVQNFKELHHFWTKQ